MCIKPLNIINSSTGEEVRIECGKCIQCRMKKCRTWALKLYHESQYYSKMCMITLTFKPAFLFRPRIKKLEKWKTIKDENDIPRRIKTKKVVSFSTLSHKLMILITLSFLVMSMKI